MPMAAARRSDGINNPMPPASSATPLIQTSSRGAGSAAGTIAA